MTGNECELLFMKQVEGRQAAILASKLTWVALKFSRAFQWTKKAVREPGHPHVLHEWSDLACTILLEYCRGLNYIY